MDTLDWTLIAIFVGGVILAVVATRLGARVGRGRVEALAGGLGLRLEDVSRAQDPRREWTPFARASGDREGHPVELDVDWREAGGDPDASYTEYASEVRVAHGGSRDLELSFRVRGTGIESSHPEALARFLCPGWTADLVEASRVRFLDFPEPATSWSVQGGKIRIAFSGIPGSRRRLEAYLDLAGRLADRIRSAPALEERS